MVAASGEVLLRGLVDMQKENTHFNYIYIYVGDNINYQNNYTYYNVQL